MKETKYTFILCIVLNTIMSNICYICKIEEGDRFTPDPAKRSIFYVNCFLYVSQKKSRN